MTGHFGGVFRRNAHNLITRLDLLRDQWLRGCHEYHFALGEPSVEVVHHYGGDERLAQTSRERHQRVLKERLLHYRVLVIALRKIDYHHRTSEPRRVMEKG